ncbi:hypothetical protein VTO42DRAFT_1172 [Malbranchea cinnamomea]
MASTVRSRKITRLDSRPPDVQKHEKPAQFNASDRAVNRLALLSFDQIPAWHQDNKYILHGYRPSTNSIMHCLQSWTYIHNETANIYTHFFPAVFFAGLEVWAHRHFTSLYPESNALDHFVFAFFLLTAVTCLGLSTTYHTLMNHSEKVSEFCLCMDYLGIVGLILGDIVSGTYVVFYCEPTLRTLYWGMAATLSTLSCLILLNPRFQGQKWRLFRVSTFVCTGLSAVAPLAHGMSMFGTAYMLKHSGLSYYLVEGFLHILGVFFYATRIPESLKPGKFDIWCSSHQIFHVLVVLATVSQLFGVWTAFDYKYKNRVCQVPPMHGGF